MSVLSDSRNTLHLSDMSDDEYQTDDRAHIVPRHDTRLDTLPTEVDHVAATDITSTEVSTETRKRDYVAVGVLFVINLLNYMDRFTIAGLLNDVKTFYNLDDKMVGLLQTSFIISYMALSPVFGYLGDRWNRKYLIIAGIFLWSMITLASSFVPGEYFYIFMLMRSLVGIGEASYSTVAPTILADMFAGDQRTKIMSLFYFAIPVGSGMGYIIGTKLAEALGGWQWGLRFTPILGVVCLLLLIILVRDPSRGRAEGGTHLTPTSWPTDIRRLVCNPSFMLITFGFTCVAFVTGALSWWAVIFIEISLDNQYNDSLASDRYPVAILFGLVTCFAGLIGVIAGSETARRLRKKTIKSDPLVCAFGLIGSTPFLFAAIVAARSHFYLCFVLIFLGETLLCLNWALVADMTMSVVIPTRRSSASAFQMIISHALGDAGSPYIVGMISDGIANNLPEGMASSFLSRQYALYVNAFVCVIGGGFFLACSLYIGKGKARVHQIVTESREHFQAVGTSYEPVDEEDSLPHIRSPSVRT